MSRNRLSTSPHEEAIDWLARENEGRLTPEQQAQLQAWLDADPERPALYERVRGAVSAASRRSVPSTSTPRSSSFSTSSRSTCPRP